MPAYLTAAESVTNDADVRQIYALLLARAPEARSSIEGSAGHPLAPVLCSFMVSDEFKSKFGLTEHGLVVSDAMLSSLDPELLGWVRSVTTQDAAGDGGTVDRLTVIRNLLGDEHMGEAFDAVGVDPRDIDTLRVALAQLDDVIRVIDGSALFDPSYYLGQLPSDQRVAHPAAHYVLHGERTGLRPSATFDAGIYAELHADVAASNLNRLFHYEAWGQQEGRAYRDWLEGHVMAPVPADHARPTILLLLHEATYTGAPILGWNLARALSVHAQVVVVLARGGALEEPLRGVASALVLAPPARALAEPLEMQRFAERLVALYQPLYVIANSRESRPIAVALRRYGCPVVALIHEFLPGAPPGIRSDFYADCSALVFPARIVEQSSFHAFRETALQNRFILPQGPCAIPPYERPAALTGFGPPIDPDEDPAISLEALLSQGERGAGPFTVVGLGAVEMRKGIDLFIAAATALRTKHPGLAFCFIWIGSWEHAIGTEHAALLMEQQERSALRGLLHFFPATDNLEPVYARADALFLSSRLDPLPNVAIDAAFRGLPVVCFDRASGMAELLSADPETADLVVPHLDSGAAADRIAALATDPAVWNAASTAIRQFAQRSFDMDVYARRLDEIGHAAARKCASADKDRLLIEDHDAFDAAIYGAANQDAAPIETIGVTAYLDETSHINFASPPVFGCILRRPSAGFHPFIYGMEGPHFPRDGSRDPLAHYVEHGRPDGRWAHRVLRPDRAAPRDDAGQDAISNDTDTAPPQRPVAIHGHFHYSDNIGDFMTALAVNQLRADLFLTTTSAATADVLRAATDDYAKGTVVVEVGPNVGRDIFAFLRVLRTRIGDAYDIVGHLHGKRSVHTHAIDPAYGDRWRRFLWEHLLGPEYSTADLIVAEMRRDPGLGLVFPENGFLIGWEKNIDSAAALVRRLGLRAPLPSHIEFPAGTMFWARAAALDRLIQADLGEDEMPAEPLPIDGTLLHALERMLPILCEDAGYRYATTYIPHIRQ